MAKASLAIAIRWFTDCRRGQADRGPAQGDQGTGQRGLIGPQTFGCLCCRRGLCQPCRSISWLGAPCTGGLWPQVGGGCRCPTPGPQGSERQSGAGLARGVPPAEPLARQGVRHPGPPLPPFVGDTAAGMGPRHPHHPGATRPQRCGHHHDLHACAHLRSARGTKPSRHSGTGRTGGSRTR
jgi:hypothetical protein